MIQSFRAKLGLTLGLSALMVVGLAQSAFAAASPTTGVDYVTDLVTPVKSELTLAIVAGLALLVVIIALRVGIRMVRSFGK
jgi:hypothetical protein